MFRSNDLTVLINDPLFKEFTPMPDKQTLEDLERRINYYHIPSFTSYIHTIQKVPSQTVFAEYLNEITTYPLPTEPSARKIPLVTKQEKEAIVTRKLWTDIISETEYANRSFKAINNVKQTVLNRLEKLGFSNVNEVYQSCLSFLTNESKIVMSFKGFFLNKSFTDYKPLNGFSKNEIPTISARNSVEKKLYSHLAPELFKEFKNNSYLRPTYAALCVADKNGHYQNVSTYGKSYIIFKPNVKSKALFLPSDSFGYFTESMTAVTFNHFDLLLSQIDDEGLRAIALRVVNGTRTDSGYYGRGCGYIEVQLNGVNALDSEMVESIHIDTHEFSIKRDTRALFKKLGITISGSVNPALEDKLLAAFQTGKKNIIKKVIKHEKNLTQNFEYDEFLYFTLLKNIYEHRIKSFSPNKHEQECLDKIQNLITTLDETEHRNRTSILLGSLYDNFKLLIPHQQHFHLTFWPKHSLRHHLSRIIEDFNKIDMLLSRINFSENDEIKLYLQYQDEAKFRNTTHSQPQSM